MADTTGLSGRAIYRLYQSIRPRDYVTLENFVADFEFLADELEKERVATNDLAGIWHFLGRLEDTDPSWFNTLASPLKARNFRHATYWDTFTEWEVFADTLLTLYKGAAIPASWKGPKAPLATPDEVQKAAPKVQKAKAVLNAKPAIGLRTTTAQPNGSLTSRAATVQPVQPVQKTAVAKMHWLDGRFIEPMPFRRGGEPANAFLVYVGKVAKSTTRTVLKEYFEQFGVVASVIKNSGWTFAFVRFESKAGVKACLGMDAEAQQERCEDEVAQLQDQSCNVSPFTLGQSQRPSTARQLDRGEVLQRRRVSDDDDDSDEDGDEDGDDYVLASDDGCYEEDYLKHADDHLNTKAAGGAGDASPGEPERTIKYGSRLHEFTDYQFHCDDDGDYPKPGKDALVVINGETRYRIAGYARKRRGNRGLLVDLDSNARKYLFWRRFRFHPKCGECKCRHPSNTYSFCRFCHFCHLGGEQECYHVYPDLRGTHPEQGKYRGGASGRGSNVALDDLRRHGYDGAAALTTEACRQIVLASRRQSPANATVSRLALAEDLRLENEAKKSAWQSKVAEDESFRLVLERLVQATKEVTQQKPATRLNVVERRGQDELGDTAQQMDELDGLAHTLGSLSVGVQTPPPVRRPGPSRTLRPTDRLATPKLKNRHQQKPQRKKGQEGLAVQSPLPSRFASRPVGGPPVMNYEAFLAWAATAAKRSGNQTPSAPSSPSTPGTVVPESELEAPTTAAGQSAAEAPKFDMPGFMKDRKRWGSMSSLSTSSDEASIHEFERERQKAANRAARAGRAARAARQGHDEAGRAHASGRVAGGASLS